MFDILWRAKMEVSGASQVEARTAAYKWLSEVMKVPIEFAHIGMFDEEQCKQLIKICKPYCDKL